MHDQYFLKKSYSKSEASEYQRSGARDYSLLGESAKRSVKSGLASAHWYKTEISRKQLKELMKRSDSHAIFDTAIWLVCLISFLLIAVTIYPSWWCIPFWMAYGVLYGSSTDSRWHECGHGTAFKTQWMNDTLYQIACFMIMRNPVIWRYGHTRHHTDTTIVGRDPQILSRRPPNLLRMGANLFGIVDVTLALRSMVELSFGHVSAEERQYVPQSELPSAVFVARIWFLIYLTTGSCAVFMQSILPFLVIGLPRMYGAWHQVITGILQHAALADNVPDYRLNTRTILMNPVSRFIYWNMNYHIEHHMFPLVPYYNLPKLHELIKHDTPAPSNSVWQALKETVPVQIKQLKDPEVFTIRTLPETAKPYKWD